jgi:hypothetical protein
MGKAADTMNPDELEAQLADRVPAFAGWVHKDDGSTVMMMVRSGETAASDRSAAAAALMRAMESKVAVKLALRDAPQLLTFKDKVFAMASVKGVIATSVDRAANRVEVTYTQELAANAIEELAAKLVAAGAPRAALVMKPGELPSSVATTGGVFARTAASFGGRCAVQLQHQQRRLCLFGGCACSACGRAWFCHRVALQRAGLQRQCRHRDDSA